MLHATGAVECWGTNGYGELGTGIIGSFDTTTLPDVGFDGTGVYGGPSSNAVGASSDAGRAPTGVTPTMLPSVSGSCPTMASGTRTVAVGGTSMTWDFWSGSPSASGPNGPIVIYWNSGSNAEEALTMLGQTALLDVENNGGIIAAAEKSSGVGASTDDGTWTTGDIAYADQVVACAIQDLHADPSRIHVIGYGVGGLETVYMWYARSGYVASALTYSGGLNRPQRDFTAGPHASAARARRARRAWIRRDVRRLRAGKRHVGVRHRFEEGLRHRLRRQRRILRHRAGHRSHALGVGLLQGAPLQGVARALRGGPARELSERLRDQVGRAWQALGRRLALARARSNRIHN